MSHAGLATHNNLKPQRNKRRSDTNPTSAQESLTNNMNFNTLFPIPESRRNADDMGLPPVVGALERQPQAPTAMALEAGSALTDTDRLTAVEARTPKIYDI